MLWCLCCSLNSSQIAHLKVNVSSYIILNKRFPFPTRTHKLHHYIKELFKICNTQLQIRKDLVWRTHLKHISNLKINPFISKCLTLKTCYVNSQTNSYAKIYIYNYKFIIPGK